MLTYKMRRQTSDVSVGRMGSPKNTRRVRGRRLNQEQQRLIDREADSTDYLTINSFASNGTDDFDREHLQKVSGKDNSSFGSRKELNNPLLSSQNRMNHAHPNELNITPKETSSTKDLHWTVFLPYYLPFLSWVKQYNFSFFVGDLIGGLSLVFFQIPLALSYATSLAHVPVTCGLYSLAISPLVYLIFGSVPQMIVGPEAAILMIVGLALQPLIHAQRHIYDPVDLVSIITFVSGTTLLGFGLGRLGYLDNVLSASLLKGFICGVGIVMVIDAAVVMAGLSELMEEISEDPSQMAINSPFDKLHFLALNFRSYHRLTLTISLLAFLFILVVRILKNHFSKLRYRFLKIAIYIPEILIAVVVSTYLCYRNDWDNLGVAIIGPIKNEDNSIVFRNPINIKKWGLIKKLTRPGIFCAMLGFFESTTALKSLGSRYRLPISSNRELVALGFINMISSVVGGLPAFGGYGRSKINAISAKTTVLGGIMGLCTIYTVFNLLDALHYVPKATLSAVAAVIGILLVDEAPYELWFHWRSRGFDELITFAITVIATLLFSMEAGIAVGIVYLLIRVIKHSAKSRIQILGRIPGTNTFVDADVSHSAADVDCLETASVKHDPFIDLRSCQKDEPLNLFTDSNFSHLNLQVLEKIEGCLIIKIPEPLTFTNTNDLVSRLKRVELFGSARAHPALKVSKDTNLIRYIIFDLDGMTELDSSAARMLKDLLNEYHERGVISFFVRIFNNNKLLRRLRNAGIESSLRRDMDLITLGENPDNILSSIVGLEITSQSPGSNRHPFPNKSVAADAAGNEHAFYLNFYENLNAPYLLHITDALRLIDYYENAALQQYVGTV